MGENASVCAALPFDLDKSRNLTWDGSRNSKRGTDPTDGLNDQLGIELPRDPNFLEIPENTMLLSNPQDAGRDSRCDSGVH